MTGRRATELEAAGEDLTDPEAGLPALAPWATGAEVLRRSIHRRAGIAAECVRRRGEVDEADLEAALIGRLNEIAGDVEG